MSWEVVRGISDILGSSEGLGVGKHGERPLTRAELKLGFIRHFTAALVAAASAFHHSVELQKQWFLGDSLVIPKSSKDHRHHLLCLVTQLSPTLCDPVDCSPQGSSVHGDSPGKNTRVGCHALLQGIFPIQGLNPGLPHCRWILYRLSHKGSPWAFKKKKKRQIHRLV